MIEAITFSELSKAQEESGLWQLLRNEFGRSQPRPADSVTVKEYADAEGLSSRTADTRLEGLVKAGKLQRSWFREGTRRTKCYVEVKTCPTSTPSTTGRTGKTKGRNGG
jgi:hypothetical protein